MPGPPPLPQSNWWEEVLSWSHLGVALLGILGTLVVGFLSNLVQGSFWAGSVRPEMKLEIAQDMASLENDLRSAIKDFEDQIDKKIDDMAALFDDSFKAIRQKISDVETTALREFASKSVFDDFRKEYREDIRNFRNDVKVDFDRLIAMMMQNHQQQQRISHNKPTG